MLNHFSPYSKSDPSLEVSTLKLLESALASADTSFDANEDWLLLGDLAAAMPSQGPKLAVQSPDQLNTKSDQSKLSEAIVDADHYDEDDIILCESSDSELAPSTPPQPSTSHSKPPDSLLLDSLTNNFANKTTADNIHIKRRPPTSFKEVGDSPHENEMDDSDDIEIIGFESGIQPKEAGQEEEPFGMTSASRKRSRPSESVKEVFIDLGDSDNDDVAQEDDACSNENDFISDEVDAKEEERS
ncbi:unnamed protein product, partial [Protopolystoma xenopodis]